MEVYLILIFAVANMFGVIGTWMTDSRGKSVAIGYFAGLALGPIGLLLLRLLFPQKRS